MQRSIREIRMNLYDGYNHPLVADTYDFVVPYRERKDVDFFVDLARECPQPVLELGCGTGRILIPTARVGVDVAGLDCSPEMLRVCRQSLERESPDVQRRVQLIEGDMRAFHLDRRFHRVVVPFRAFHHLLEIPDQLACLECTFAHLEAGGQLILDLFNPSLPYLYDKRFLDVAEEEPPFSLPDGRRMIRRSRLLARNLHKQIIDLEFLYEWEDENREIRQHSHRFRMRYFFRYEIEHLLARVGFTLETVYADYKKSPFGSQYPGELIVVARK